MLKRSLCHLEVMQHVADLLDPNAPGFSPARALVCLWVLAAEVGRLNQWEQREDEQSVEQARAAFDDALAIECGIALEEIAKHPLALIRALDDHLAALGLLSSRVVRTSSEFAHEVSGRCYWLVAVPLQARRCASTTMQAGRHSRWFHHHAVLPCTTAYGLDVGLQRSRSLLDARLWDLGVKVDAQLRVWIAHFCDGADVTWDQTQSPVRHWRSRGIEPHRGRGESIAETLRRSAAVGAHVVIFPEFTVDLQHRHAVERFLRRQGGDASCPALVVAGSFHGPGHGEDAGNVYNHAPVYACGGRRLFTHCKLRLFGDAASGAEYAQAGRRLEVLVTPIGCMTVLICKDFIDDEPSVCGLLKEVPVDWVWVPSYGNPTTLRLHKQKASQLARVTPGTSVAVAQTRNSAMEVTGPELPGFGHPAGTNTRPTDVPEVGGYVDLPLARQSAPALRIVK